MAKKFKFRFEVVLNKVAKEMDAIAIVLAKQRKELKQAERIRRGFEIMLENYNNQFRASKKESFVIEELILYQRFLMKVISDISSQEEKIALIKVQINETRTKLIAKNKEKKVLEKIKEDDYHDFVQAIEQAEQRFLDELATLNYNRVDALKKGI